MNQQFARNMDLVNNINRNMNINNNILDDRDLFNKISNTDNTRNFTDRDKRLGQTTCNRKDLNENIYNTNENSNFKANSNNNFNNYEMFNNQNNINDINEMNNINEINEINEINDLNDIKDDLERDIMIYEYSNNMNKEKEFIFDINSPYGIAYVWKTLILTTKNPSNEKILKMLNIRNKEILINDLNNQSVIFRDFGEITYNFDGEENININYSKKLEEMFNVKCTNSLNSRNICLINMIFRYELKIPYYYNPEIINFKFYNYRDVSLKFIRMLNVPVSIISEKLNNKEMINIEIPMCENMRLGFIFDNNRELVEDYEKIYNMMIREKRYNIKVKNLIIPKLNRTKKSNYSNKFGDNLNNIHVGELCYGKLMKILMNIFTKLEINVERNIEIERYEIEREMENIVINNKLLYYIRNERIKNRILFSGVINYK